MFPAKSFIDVRDFSSPRALAEHLSYLDANDTAYQEYFQWRRKYKLVSVGPVTMNISHTEGKIFTQLIISEGDFVPDLQCAAPR